MKNEICYYVNSPEPKILAAVGYVLDHLGRDYDIDFRPVPSKAQAEISIGESVKDDFWLASRSFLRYSNRGDSGYNPFKVLDGSPVLVQEDKPDFILSAFVLLSGMQEWVSKKKDKWGRFPYQGSFQEKYGKARVAWVDRYFEKIYQQLKEEISLSFSIKQRSYVVLTHDIDHLKWPVIQNGYSFVKGLAGSRKKRWLSKLPLLLKNTRRNVEDIMALEDQYGVNSVFFWLTIQGKGMHGIKNADYSLEEQYVQRMMAQIVKRGGSNGLHKSTQPIPMVDEFKSNLELMPINRYHYLLCNLPSDSEEINQSVKQDYTLGFAEEMGFRNSYSRPYHPFDFKNWKPFQFLEVPLHIMDTTFRGYKKLTPEEAEEEILFFLSKHSNNSCLSLLWHNDYFTPFKFDGWGKVYENILHFLFEENRYQSLTAKEIDHKYRIY